MGGAPTTFVPQWLRARTWHVGEPSLGIKLRLASWGSVRLMAWMWIMGCSYAAALGLVQRCEHRYQLSDQIMTADHSAEGQASHIDM